MLEARPTSPSPCVCELALQGKVVCEAGAVANGETGVVKRGVSGGLLTLLLVPLDIPLAFANLCGCVSGSGPAPPPNGLERFEDVFGLEQELLDEEAEGAGEVACVCSGSGSISISTSSRSNPAGVLLEVLVSSVDEPARGTDDDDGPRAPARDESVLVGMPTDPETDPDEVADPSGEPISL